MSESNSTGVFEKEFDVGGVDGCEANASIHANLKFDWQANCVAVLSSPTQKHFEGQT